MVRRNIWLRILSFIVIFLLVAVRPVNAESTPNSEEKPVQLRDSSIEQSMNQGVFLYLASGTFDPLQGVPTFSASLTYTAEEAGAAGVYIVQFKEPVGEEWKQALIDSGAHLGSYLPDYAFIVSMPGSVKAQVESLPFVRWIGTYEPAYRLSAAIDGSDMRSYRILIGPWADQARLQMTISAIDSHSRAFEGGFTAVMSGEQVVEMAREAGVLWIEPLSLQQLNNNVSAGTIMGGTTAWSSGYTGSGVSIAVTDTGLDTGNLSDIHQDFAGRVAHLESWPVQYANYGGGCEVLNDGADDGAADTQSGHGSHVTGSFAGNGASSSGVFKGLAYQATINFQAVEQYTTWVSPDPLICPNGYYLSGIPDDVRELLNEAYSWGTRVQNNSWSGGEYGDYDIQARNFDDFVFNHQDMTVVVSAGNYGIDANANGYVDDNSIRSPGTSKNLISIGASDNERSNGGYSLYTWGQLWSADFPIDPTKSDYTSDTRQELAAFSSRGPLEDGRIKPDLVAPGTNIISVRSSEAIGTGWGTYNSYYMYMGGTSMSSPLSAGAAALVRDYYITSEGIANPSAALIKATLINTAVDISGYNNGTQEAGNPIPNNHEGWGLVNVAAATTTGRSFIDENSGIATGNVRTYTYNVISGEPFKVSLVWSDYPGNPAAGKALVNDLNLRLTAPNGSTKYWGNYFSGGWSVTGGSADTLNNVENAYIQNPTNGSWKVEVIGSNVPNGPQAYALVVDGNVQLAESFEVTGFSPSMAYNNAILQDAKTTGDGFESGATVTLVNGVHSINGTNVVVDTANDVITADFNLNGANLGLWDVRVNNPSENAILVDAFRVLDSTKPDLVITKTTTDSYIDPGSLLVYTISIENAGITEGTNVIFTDTLPDGVTFKSLTPLCATLIPLADGFRCEVQPATLNPGQGIDYNLEVSVPDEQQGFIVNSVEVANSEGDAYPNNNQDQVSVLIGNVGVYLPLVYKLSSFSDAIQNGDFEDGRDGSWDEFSSHGYQLIVDTFEPNLLLPHSGDWGAWLGGAPDEVSTISQQVTVPPGTPTLSFWIYLDSAETICSNDSGKVTVNGDVLATYELCQETDTGGWVQREIDISSYAGMTITIGFKATLNSTYNSNFFLDDVVIQ